MAQTAMPDYEGFQPPEGYVLVESEDGKRFWMDPKAIDERHEATPLTGEQLRRIRWCKEVFQEHDSMSLAETLQGFSKDPNPEAELQVWERCARVYQAELEARPEADEEERRALYQAVMACSFTTDRQQILATNPALASLPELDRVILRYEEAGETQAPSA